MLSLDIEARRIPCQGEENRVASAARIKHRQNPRASAPRCESERDQPTANGASADHPASSRMPGGSLLIALRLAGATIGWISGSLAGIGAIFYGFGYLATLANLDLLGLDLLTFHYDPTFYIRRGAGFLLLSLIDVGQLWLWLFGFLAVVFVCSQISGVREIELWTKQPFRSMAAHRNAWKIAAYFALLLVLGGQLRSHFLFPDDLAVSGMLYTKPGEAAMTGSLREWLVAGDTARLEDRYAIFVNQQVVIALLVFIAWGLTRAWRWRILLTAPFAIVLTISLAWLPLEYGKVALPNKFAQVLVRFVQSSNMGNPPPATMYLLSMTDTDFVLWDPERRKVLWIPNRSVSLAEISASLTLSEIIKSAETSRR